HRDVCSGGGRRLLLPGRTGSSGGELRSVDHHYRPHRALRLGLGLGVVALLTFTAVSRWPRLVRAGGLLEGAHLGWVAVAAGAQPGWSGVFGGLAAVALAVAGLAVLHRRGRLAPLAVVVIGGLLGAWQRLARRGGDPRTQAEAAWQRLRGLMPDRRTW